MPLYSLGWIVKQKFLCGTKTERDGMYRQLWPYCLLLVAYMWNSREGVRFICTPTHSLHSNLLSAQVNTWLPSLSKNTHTHFNILCLIYCFLFHCLFSASECAIYIILERERERERERDCHTWAMIPGKLQEEYDNEDGVVFQPPNPVTDLKTNVLLFLVPGSCSSLPSLPLRSAVSPGSSVRMWGMWGGGRWPSY